MRELPGHQQSDRWIKNRIGRITGSRMGDVMSTLSRKSKNGDKGEPGAAYIRYRRELITERILGRASDHYVTRYMEEGSEREDEARSMYEIEMSVMVAPVNFVLHPRFDFAGATPDGLIGEDGILEIKSPKPETLVEWIESGDIPAEYAWQAQWEMVCTERKWCDFWGWYPGMPFCRVRLERSDFLTEQMESRVEALNEEIETFLANNGYPRTIWNLADFDEGKSPDGYDPEADYINELARVVGADEIAI